MISIITLSMMALSPLPDLHSESPAYRKVYRYQRTYYYGIQYWTMDRVKFSDLKVGDYVKIYGERFKIADKGFVKKKPYKNRVGIWICPLSDKPINKKE